MIQMGSQYIHGKDFKYLTGVDLCFLQNGSDRSEKAFHLAFSSVNERPSYSVYYLGSFLVLNHNTFQVCQIIIEANHFGHVPMVIVKM